MNTFELVKYYADLLILQYINKPKASATIKAQAAATVMCQTTVQTIVFGDPPTEGDFILEWDGQQSPAINFNDDIATIESKIRSISGLGSVDVTGTFTAVDVGTSAVEQTEIDGYSGLTTNPNVGVGNVWQHPDTENLDSIRLWLKNTTGAAGNVTLFIYDVTTNVPVGAAIGESDPINWNTIGSEPVLTDFVFSTPPALVAGNKYAWVMFGVQTGGLVHIGSAFTTFPLPLDGKVLTVNGGSSWLHAPPEDFAFQINHVVDIQQCITTLKVVFTDVEAPAELLELGTSTLNSTPTIAETDVVLPLAVQAGFNLLETDDAELAVGDQLDTLGRYVGVLRSGLGFTENITLNDAEFLTLIRMAIAINHIGSSTSEIQAFINQYFADQIFMYDHQNMRLSYLISTDVGSQDLMQLFIMQGLLPKPMGVSLALIYSPDIEIFFGYRTYLNAAVFASPYNTYDDYETDRPFLSYAYAINI